MPRFVLLTLLAAGLHALLVGNLARAADRFAQATRVWPDAARIPADRRLGPPRRVTEGSHFRPPTDRAAWAERVRGLHEQTLVAAGLWPLPDRCPLDAHVTGTTDCGDYVVENVYFAAYPGFYVTGSVFRPKGQGPYPGVLSPHGHFPQGRFQDGRPRARNAKPDPDPFPLQARCANLARLGCVAFLYDMVGYADSRQIRHPSDSPATRLPEGTDEFEGLSFEQYCLSTLGLQTWDSIRALDYLVSRPDVDPARLACTGESGGATQTLLLMMADPRLAAAAPVCMVSTGFQGDCVCEQAALGRIGTDGVEFCASFAPKPLIVVGATGDWTREIMEKGGPEIQATYNLLGAGDHFRVVRFPAPHNYNRASREAVYTWFNRWLRLGAAEPVRDQPFKPLTPGQLAVFTERHPRPADALDAAGLKRFLIRSAEQQMERLRPTDSGRLKRFRATVGTALEHLVASNLPEPAQVDVQALGSFRHGDVTVERLLLGRRGSGEQVPALLWAPASASGRAAVVVHPAGKAGLVRPDGTPDDLLAGLLAQGVRVLAVDPFLTGEYNRPGQPTPAPSPRTGFFACFNRTLLANRVHDILTAVGYLHGRPEVKRVDLVGVGEAGPWCLLARGLCGDAVDRTAADVGGFSFRSVRDVDNPMYLPGALRYGDLAALTALAAPGPLFLSGVDGWDTSWLRAAYQAAGSADGHSARLRLAGKAASPADWLAWLQR